jgi:hypothetical protein
LTYTLACVYLTFPSAFNLSRSQLFLILGKGVYPGRPLVPHELTSRLQRWFRPPSTCEGFLRSDIHDLKTSCIESPGCKEFAEPDLRKNWCLEAGNAYSTQMHPVTDSGGGQSIVEETVQYDGSEPLPKEYIEKISKLSSAFVESFGDQVLSSTPNLIYPD